MNMRSLRESSPLRGDTDIEDALASFNRWLTDRLPLNRRSDIPVVLSIASKEKLDPMQLKSLQKGDAEDLGIPWGFLLALKKEVSPWKDHWNAHQRVISRPAPRAPTANMSAPSQRTIPDTYIGDSIPTDIVYDTYPDPEFDEYLGIGNSQKQDWEGLFDDGLFGGSGGGGESGDDEV